jgi:hypothetical protein
MIRYGVKISVFYPYDPQRATDYDAYVDNNHGTLTGYLIAHEPFVLAHELPLVPLHELFESKSSLGNRTLDVEHNYKGYGNNSVTLSVNLGNIGYPTRYTVLFYSEYNHSLADEYILYAIPPHRNILHIMWPSVMIAGDDAFFPVHVNSTDLTPGVLHLWDPGNAKISLTFNPDQINLSVNNQSAAITQMLITGTQNLDPGLYHNRNIEIPEDLLSSSQVLQVEARYLYPYLRNRIQKITSLLYKSGISCRSAD